MSDDLHPSPSASTAGKDPVKSGISGIFGALLGIAVALALAVLIVPSQEYLTLSNDLQLIAAFAGAAAFLVLWFRYGRNTGMLYAAVAFGLWGVSNIAWYVTVLNGGREWVFPSLIDMGIVASIIILTSAIGRLAERKPFPGQVVLGVLIVSLAIPLVILFATGFSGPALMTLLYFFACGTLIITALNRGLAAHTHAITGTLLFALAFMIYPLREMFFAGSQFLNVIGLFVAAGFSLMVIGLLPFAQPVAKTPAAEEN